MPTHFACTSRESFCRKNPPSQSKINNVTIDRLLLIQRRHVACDDEPVFFMKRGRARSTRVTLLLVFRLFDTLTSSRVLQAIQQNWEGKPRDHGQVAGRGCTGRCRAGRLLAAAAVATVAAIVAGVAAWLLVRFCAVVWH